MHRCHPFSRWQRRVTWRRRQQRIQRSRRYWKGTWRIRWWVHHMSSASFRGCVCVRLLVTAVRYRTQYRLSPFSNSDAAAPSLPCSLQFWNFNRVMSPDARHLPILKSRVYYLLLRHSIVLDNESNWIDLNNWIITTGYWIMLDAGYWIIYINQK